MTIETLVTIHDQSLIDSCEAEHRFEHVRPYNYLFVGPRDPGPVGSYSASIIWSAMFDENFEHWPQFYDFTGWWVAAHHKLIGADRLICLQYDHQVPADPRPSLDPLLDDHPMVAFVAGHRAAGNFMLGLGGFEEAYRAGLATVGALPMESWSDFNEWPSTQGTAWRTEALVEFMEWVTPLFELWHDNVWAGHLMERMPKAWLVTTGREPGYLHGAVVHENRDCHGTGALMGGRSDVYAERAATFGR